MSQNNRELYNYLGENIDFDFGTFDEFNQDLKDPIKAEDLRKYLNENMEDMFFGDSATFYNRVNEPKDAFDSEKPSTENIFESDRAFENSNTTKTTVENPDQILSNEMNEEGSSEQVFKSIANADFEQKQQPHSSDYGLFQINDKYWSEMSNNTFGRSVSELNPLENIQLASMISKSPLGMNNWQAFKNKKYLDFEGISDEEIIQNYGVNKEVLDMINTPGLFDNPQLYKQIMLAESAGNPDAININYTPQQEDDESVFKETMAQASSVVDLIQQQSKMQTETVDPASTDVVSEFEQKLYPNIGFGRTGFTGTQIAPFLRNQTHKALTSVITSPKSGIGGLLNTREFQTLKPIAEVGVNAISILPELIGLMVDIPTALAVDPIETAIGLVKYYTDEYNNLLLATNVLDVVNPLLLDEDVKIGNTVIVPAEFTREELEDMKVKATKHMYDTGGVYTYLALAGVTNMGIKNSKTAIKSRELRDIVEMANERPAMGKVTPEMLDVVEKVKKNQVLKEKLEKAKENQLLTDYLEKWEADKLIEKAEKTTIEQGQLSLDLKSRQPQKPSVIVKTKKIQEKHNKLDKEVKSSVEKIDNLQKEITENINKIEKENVNVESIEIKKQATKESASTVKVSSIKSDRLKNEIDIGNFETNKIMGGLEGGVYKAQNGVKVKIIKESPKSIGFEILTGKNKGSKFTHIKKNTGGFGTKLAINSRKYDLKIYTNLKKQTPKAKPKEAPKAGEAVNVEAFYDKKQKKWAINKLDGNNNKIGKTEYATDRGKARKRAKEIKKELNIVSDKPIVVKKPTSSAVKETKIKEKKGERKELILNIGGKKEVFKVRSKSKKEPVSKDVKKQEIKSEKEVGKSIIQEVKLKKSSDLAIGKKEQPIKNEKARRFKYKQGLDSFIESKLSEYVGQNIVVRYGKTAKGDYVAKVFKKVKEQPLPKTATKRPPLSFKDSKTEIATLMRDPRISKRRIQNQDILLEKYSLEISELTRNLNKQIDELAKLELQSLESGISSPRIEIIKNSIDSINKTILKSQENIRVLKTTKQLAKEIGNNILKRKAKGQIGGDAKKTRKERIEQQLRNEELVGHIQEIWTRGQTGLKFTKSNLVRLLKDLDTPKDIVKFVNENFKFLYDEATVRNAKILANEINAERPLSDGPVKGTRTATRTRDEYINNLRVDIISGKEKDPVRLQAVDLLENISNNIGGELSIKAKRTRSLDAIEKRSRDRDITAQIVHERKTGKLSIDNLPEKVSNSAHQSYSLLVEYSKNPTPEIRKEMLESLYQTYAYISEPARATRALRDLKAENIRDWSIFKDMFPNDPELLSILGDIANNKQIKRSRLFKLSEFGRNAKLATGSAIVRSGLGNAMGTIDAYARMPFEFGWDYLNRKTSSALYELTNGQFGNLSRNQITRLEIGAHFRGVYDSFGKTGQLMLDMFLENDNALRESAFFKREGFTHKDIAGKKGVIIRTPQRLQGMIDIMYRVPITNGYFYRQAVRQAYREGYKTQAEVLQRASNIVENPRANLKDSFYKEAIRDGEYVTFQRELGSIGKWINSLRVGQGRPQAVAQMIVPFFNTAGNLFKWGLEHTPLNVVMDDFRRGFVEAYTAKNTKSREFLEKKLQVEAKFEGSRTLATELGKISTGLGSLYLLNHFLLENSAGNITGDWSDDTPSERNMKTVDGMQEYAVRTKDGNWVSYRGFEPLASYLTMLHSLQRTNEEALKSENKKETGKMVYEMTKSLTESFLENPFISSTGDMFKVLNGRKDFGDFGFNFLSGMTVPGVFRQLNSIANPTREKRLKLSDVNENVDMEEYLKSQARSVYPWFVEGSNLDALDPFGRAIPKVDPVGGLFAWRKSMPKNDPVYKEIQTVYFDREKDFDLPSTYFTQSDLAKIKLTPEEHFALIKLSGEQLYNTIDKFLKTDYYQEMTPAMREKLISKTKSNYIKLYRTSLFAGELIPLQAEMSAKELSGEFENPEDLKNFLKEKRSFIKRRTVDEIMQDFELAPMK